MFNIITKVQAVKKNILNVTYADGKVFVFDVSTLFKKYPVFKQLKKGKLFKEVKVEEGGYAIYWNDEIDLSSEYIYNHGKHIYDIISDLNIILGERVADRRNELEMSQRELAREAKIPQPEISKIEAGKGNPTVTTIQKIANVLKINASELLVVKA